MKIYTGIGLLNFPGLLRLFVCLKCADAAFCIRVHSQKKVFEEHILNLSHGQQAIKGS